MTTVKYAALAATVAALCSGGSVMAQETAKGSFAVRVVVPSYCEINSDPLVLTGGMGVETGSVMEVCNSPDGFQVVASYRELTPSENVQLNYAGFTRQLNQAGWTPVVNRMGAKFGIRPVRVQYAGLESPLSIDLTITYY